MAGENSDMDSSACHRTSVALRHVGPGFATVSWDQRGKRQRKYKAEDYRTPLEKLISLPEAEQFLKPGMSLAKLEKQALAISDTECAVRMNAAKMKLLRQCKTPALPKFA